MRTPDGGGFVGPALAKLKVVPPDILIVQDKSSSMSNDDSDQGCGNGRLWRELEMVADHDRGDRAEAPVMPCAA